jgi:hypothetical protein
VRVFCYSMSVVLCPAGTLACLPVDCTCVVVCVGGKLDVHTGAWLGPGLLCFAQGCTAKCRSHSHVVGTVQVRSHRVGPAGLPFPLVGPLRGRLNVAGIVKSL